MVTPVGRAAVVLGLLAWLLGWLLGWIELMIFAAGCVAMLALAALFTVGRATLRVQVTLDPQRVAVGNPAAGQLAVTNVSGRRMLPLIVELPVGAGVARFEVPSLADGATHDELFIAPTHRRAVITVGPATSVRGDPLGLLSRAVPWTEPVELFVHPRTLPLDTLGAGILRDLEGQATNAMSMSDLAFHTLREYVPGDDRRNVHWRTSARTGRLMVRQFVDTRRSHLVVLLDGDATSYADPEDFELAVSAAGSVLLRALRDEQTASMAAAGQVVVAGSGRRLLDGLSRAVLDGGNTGLVAMAAHAATVASDATLAVLVTGSGLGHHEIRRAVRRLSPDIRSLAVHADSAAGAGYRTTGGLETLTLTTLSDLPKLLRVVASS